jgi:hypothetical protein
MPFGLWARFLALAAAGAVAAGCGRPALPAPPPPAQPPPPEATSGTEEGKGEKPPPFDTDDGVLVYGYLGLRPIFGRITLEAPRWSGTFRFLGQREPFTVSGLARENEGEDEEDEAASVTYDGRTQHRYVDCTLDVGGSGVTGFIEGSCLDEGEMLEINGTLVRPTVKGVPEQDDEPFFVRTADTIGTEQERFYAAVVVTPTVAHRCAPFAEVVEASPRPSGRTALLYTLRWPCDAEVGDGFDAFRVKKPSVTREAYVGDVADGEPPRLVASVAWTPLGDPDEPNDISMKLRVFDLVPGVELYVATISDDFQSPVSSGGSSDQSSVAWAVGADGRYGGIVKLPPVQSGHAGVCFSTSSSQELWLTDLEGSPTPEFVAKTTTEGTVDRVTKGNHECVAAPITTSFKVYAFSPPTLSWQERPTPKSVSNRRLAAGRKLVVP